MSDELKITPGQGGDWRLHHHLLPDSPGDFRPVTVGEHHGDEHTVTHLLLQLLGLDEPAPEPGSTDCILRLGDQEAGS